MCQTCQGTTIYGMFGILKLWKLKCLNSNVWILKIKIWNSYVKCLESENLKTKMSELGCVNT
jgi:hypothetical protein